MTLPKFIITMDGYFRLGMVNQHKDLLKPGDSCLGGGYYHFDYTSNRIILDRSSYDFGKPQMASAGSAEGSMSVSRPTAGLLL